MWILDCGNATDLTYGRFHANQVMHVILEMTSRVGDSMPTRWCTWSSRWRHVLEIPSQPGDARDPRDDVTCGRFHAKLGDARDPRDDVTCGRFHAKLGDARDPQDDVTCGRFHAKLGGARDPRWLHLKCIIPLAQMWEVGHSLLWSMVLISQLKDNVLNQTNAKSQWVFFNLNKISIVHVLVYQQHIYIAPLKYMYNILTAYMGCSSYDVFTSFPHDSTTIFTVERAYPGQYSLWIFHILFLIIRYFNNKEWATNLLYASIHLLQPASNQIHCYAIYLPRL